MLRCRRQSYCSFGNGQQSGHYKCVAVAASLRHIVAMGRDCALGDEGLEQATNLVRLTCSNNPKITKIAFCKDTLQVLDAHGSHCGMRGNVLADAPALRTVFCEQNSKMTGNDLKSFESVHGLFVRKCDTVL